MKLVDEDRYGLIDLVYDAYFTVLSHIPDGKNVNFSVRAELPKGGHMDVINDLDMLKMMRILTQEAGKGKPRPRRTSKENFGTVPIHEEPKTTVDIVVRLPTHEGSKTIADTVVKVPTHEEPLTTTITFSISFPNFKKIVVSRPSKKVPSTTGTKISDKTSGGSSKEDRQRTSHK
ncbi:hypothetical protein NE237_024543 [Protea cynaroides]|uniref:Uncharacterized protein n=1 Tax=Protea cynaroides TaxID=273540 RepID=A0A9Q0H4G0_9MAGN|nr:hypothetical protein NE237_024543 [Protea cynaroides]